jgi:hypothetical protein
LGEEGGASVLLVPMLFIGSSLGEVPKGSHSDNLLTSHLDVLSFFLRKNERTKEKLKATESMTD